jgi:predicted GNAT family acetyltransferase
MKLKPKIMKTVISNGKVHLSLVSDNDVIAAFCVDDFYVDFGKPLSEREQLQVIQRAFQAGVETAIAEMSHLLRSISTERISPSAKISEVQKPPAVNRMK